MWMKFQCLMQEVNSLFEKLNIDEGEEPETFWVPTSFRTEYIISFEESSPTQTKLNFSDGESVIVKISYEELHSLLSKIDYPEE